MANDSSKEPTRCWRCSPRCERAIIAGVRPLAVVAALCAVAHAGEPKRPTADPRTIDPQTIDRALALEWKRAHVAPAPPVDDARFLRRVYLDLVGDIPTAQVATAFLDDPSPTKRAQMVAALLASPGYAAHWTNYWDRVLLGRAPIGGQLVDRAAFRAWLHGELERNAPWDAIARELIAATGQNSLGAPRPPGPAKAAKQAAKAESAVELKVERAAAKAERAATAATANATTGSGAGMMGSQNGLANSNSGLANSAAGMMVSPAGMAAPSAAPAPDPPKEQPRAPDGRVNGAVNWLLRYDKNPTDLVGKLSRVFLGVQVQCAQCHNHPTERWRQEDFRRFAAFFARTGAQQLDVGPVQGVRRVELRDFDKPVIGGPKKSELREIADLPPTTLDGGDLSTARDRRAALAAWVVGSRGFARALVNRVWAQLLGRGFFEPIDDWRRSNPVAAPAVLELVTDGLIAHKLDLKWLLATLCATRAYQLAAAPSRGRDQALWTRHALRPLPPDELLDALATATNLEAVLGKLAAPQLDKLKTQIRQAINFLFDVDEEVAQADFEGTVPQALMQINGQLFNNAASVLPGTALAEVLAMPVSDGAKVEALYLRALSRRPTATERRRWEEFVAAPRQVVGKRATAKQQAFEDLYWALLNSSEFYFRH
jgi:hypothetical protein